MPIITECFNFLKENATSNWHESYRFKNKETDDYIHPTQRGLLLFRVELGAKRAFYWIYASQDAIRFNEFVGMKLKGEAHEIILTPRTRLFFDIDLALDEIQKCEFSDHYRFDLTDENEIEIMEEVGKKLADVFKESTLISLEEHGIDIELDLVGFDYMYTMRNRPLDDDGYKISIHLITNLMLPLNACSAIVAHIKSNVIQNNIEVLDINDDMVSPLIDSIDVTQYRRHGSLSLPYGTKMTYHGECTNWIYKDFSIPGQRYFMTVEDQFTIHDIDLSAYNIVDRSNYLGVEASPEFVTEALKHVNNIKDYNTRVWDLKASILKKSTMYVKRYAPSMCSVCQRTHDSDNTLFLIFNSERGVASWKCARVPSMKPIEFYRREESAADVEAFASKHIFKPKRKVTKSSPLSENTCESKSVRGEEHNEPKQDLVTQICSSAKSRGKVVMTDGYDDEKDVSPVIQQRVSILQKAIPKQRTTRVIDDGYDETVKPVAQPKVSIPQRCTLRQRKLQVKDDGYVQEAKFTEEQKVSIPQKYASRQIKIQDMNDGYEDMGIAPTIPNCIINIRTGITSRSTKPKDEGY